MSRGRIPDLNCINYARNSIAGADYSARSLTLNFDEDTAEVCVNITIETDNTIEDNETFTVSLSTQDNAVMFLENAMNFTIVDNSTGAVELYSCIAYR